jgi:RNA polymerase sigma factor (sigma-70 family)
VAPILARRRVRKGHTASQRQHARVSNEPRADLLDRVMRRHRSALIRQARFHSDWAADADDALSEASVQFLRQFPGSTEREALLWMLTVVKRCAWRFARRRRGRRELVREVSLDAAGDEWGIDAVDERRGPAELLEARDRVERIAAAMALLRPDERRALLLIAAGYSYAEIGRICGWTKTKINRCAAEGRARLRGLLAERGERS